MNSEALSHYLGEPSLREQLTGDAAEAIVGISRDPDDARRSCIMLYVPPEFSRPLSETVTLGAKRCGWCGVNAAGLCAPTRLSKRLTP